jgi:hypothetical protein
MTRVAVLVVDQGLFVGRKQFKVEYVVRRFVISRRE